MFSLRTFLTQGCIRKRVPGLLKIKSTALVTFRLQWNDQIYEENLNILLMIKILYTKILRKKMCITLNSTYSYCIHLLYKLLLLCIQSNRILYSLIEYNKGVTQPQQQEEIIVYTPVYSNLNSQIFSAHSQNTMILALCSSP